MVLNYLFCEYLNNIKYFITFFWIRLSSINFIQYTFSQNLIYFVYHFFVQICANLINNFKSIVINGFRENKVANAAFHYCLRNSWNNSLSNIVLADELLITLSALSEIQTNWTWLCRQNWQRMRSVTIICQESVPDQRLPNEPALLMNFLNVNDRHLRNICLHDKKVQLFRPNFLNYNSQVEKKKKGLRPATQFHPGR